MARRNSGRPPEPPEPWYDDVARYMVRENCNFTQACMAMGVKFPSGKYEEMHQNRKAFQRTLWTYRNSFYENIGEDPTLTKNVVMGVLANSIKKLEEKGEYDKVATAAQILAKIAGWLGDAPSTTVFANLTQADIDLVKQRLKALSDKDLEEPTPNVQPN